MALPPDLSKIDNTLVKALQDLVSNPANNPEKIWSITIFFPDKEARVYYAPNLTLTAIPNWDNKDIDAKIHRLDGVSSVFYSINPTWQWKIKNGQHVLICS